MASKRVGAAGVLEEHVQLGVVLRVRDRRIISLRAGDRIVIDGTSYELQEDENGWLYFELAGVLAKVRQPLRQLIGRRVEL